MRRSHIPTLDGWRALAALAVVICHGAPRESFLGPLRLFGVHAVFVFFALSGLLITTGMLDELEQRGTVDLRAFYIRRVCRILPPALAFLALLFVAGSFGLMPSMSTKELLS